MRTFGRKTAIAAVAFATVGSTLFGGTALANDDNGDHRSDDKKVNAGGHGGAGGDGDAKCLIPIGVSLGLVKGVGGDVSQCNAAGGPGGTGGGATADY